MKVADKPCVRVGLRENRAGGSTPRLGSLEGTMTEDTLTIARLDTPPCELCGQVDKQAYVDLVGNQETTCGICGNSILLTDAEWLQQFAELSQDVRAQYKK